MWTRQNYLPDDEPQIHNATAYAVPQLIAGASDDGQWIYDAIYDAQAACFVLTALHINQEWGFIENERRCILSTRTALLTEIAALEHNPAAWLNA